MENKQTIPIFFAVDNGYIPFLAVALQSLTEHASEKYYYLIKVLYTDISEENQEKIKKYNKENVNIEFVDLNYYIEKVKEKLYTRDYYSKTTYFRLFIPDLYPQYNKALYLDSDITILTDVAELYNVNMKDNLIAAAPDDVIQNIPVFQDYVEKVVGVSDYRHYFNAGIIVMNLEEMRRAKFQEKFLYLLGTIKFSVAQDQDYLNRLCKGRVKLVDNTWNRMPIGGDTIKREELHLIHYNLAFKPWHFEEILYKEYFWECAKKTEFFKDILKIKENYSDEDKFNDRESDRKLRMLAQKECDCVGDDRIKLKLRNNEKFQERMRILQEIERLEESGQFDRDAEKDPPTITLESDNVDYLNEKLTSRVKNIFANKTGEYFLKNIIKTQKLLIKDIEGIENLNSIKNGAVITCNHFNPFDAFAVETAFRKSTLVKNKKLYKVIREGNYTNFPGLYGFFFRNCDTLPLSSSTRTMMEFVRATNKILQKGDVILIYPEQSLWWNYKKPKPLKPGAFKIAAKNNVPIVPIFITMEDSQITGEDEFKIQEYTMHIGKPIYPDADLTVRENTNQMREKNFEYWKNVYEAFYKIPLKYTTPPDKMPKY